MDDMKSNSAERVITIVGSSLDITMAEQLMKDRFGICTATFLLFL